MNKKDYKRQVVSSEKVLIDRRKEYGKDMSLIKKIVSKLLFSIWLIINGLINWYGYHILGLIVLFSITFNVAIKEHVLVFRYLQAFIRVCKTYKVNPWICRSSDRCNAFDLTIDDVKGIREEELNEHIYNRLVHCGDIAANSGL